MQRTESALIFADVLCYDECVHVTTQTNNKHNNNNYNNNSNSNSHQQQQQQHNRIVNTNQKAFSVQIARKFKGSFL